MRKLRCNKSLLLINKTLLNCSNVFSLSESYLKWTVGKSFIGVSDKNCVNSLQLELVKNGVSDVINIDTEIGTYYYDPLKYETQYTSVTEGRVSLQTLKDIKNFYILYDLSISITGGIQLCMLIKK